VHAIDEGRHGLPESLNLGFGRAQGRYWTYTSDDNAFLPDALRVMVEHLDAHPRAPMVCTDYYVTDAAGKLLHYNDSDWACFLYRADAARLVGPYRPEYRLVEDVDFFLRLQHLAGEFDRIRRPYYRYRVHGNSLSARQTGARQLLSLKLHHELATTGVEQLDLHALFFARLSEAALYRQYGDMDRIVEFAREKQVPFARRLAWESRLLRTGPGWLANRVRIAVKSELERARKRLKLAVARARGIT
jgi:hypothetical protein